MPNAKQAHRKAHEKFLLSGTPGSGKTAQFCTLPGKKFMYLFDSNALNTIIGQDIEYEEFLPDILSMDAVPLSKSGKAVAKRVVPGARADRYLAWEQDFEEKERTGFFNDIDWIGFDSLTTFGDIIMDYILLLNGRSGEFPQQDDYGPQMIALRNVFRSVTAMGPGIFVTAHEELIKDESSGRVMNQLLVTGKLRQRLPVLFSEIYHCECRSKANEEKFIIQTRPDRLNPNVRCTLPNLEMFHDVTIKDWSDPTKYGLGAIIAGKGRSGN